MHETREFILTGYRSSAPRHPKGTCPSPPDKSCLSTLVKKIINQASKSFHEFSDVTFYKCESFLFSSSIKNDLFLKHVRCFHCLIVSHLYSMSSMCCTSSRDNHQLVLYSVQNMRENPSFCIETEISLKITQPNHVNCNRY